MAKKTKGGPAKSNRKRIPRKTGRGAGGKFVSKGSKKA